MREHYAMPLADTSTHSFGVSIWLGVDYKI